MINDFVWWWEQLNGPQTTAIMRPLFLHIQEQLDDILNYLNEMSIDTANSTHLTLIGKLMGIPRTNITEYTDPYFFFTNLPGTHLTDLGFSLLPKGHEKCEVGQYDVGTLNPIRDESEPLGENNPVYEPYGDGDREHDYIYTEEDLEKGGVFSEESTTRQGETVAMPDEYYRVILKAVVESEASVGSLVMMDYILCELQKKDIQIPSYSYRFRWYEDEMGASNMAPGDIVVNLGSETDWNNVTVIVAAIQALEESIFAPEPRWFAEFGGGQ